MSTTYTPTYDDIDYTSSFVTADPNERCNIFYPSAGEGGWAEYGWEDSYPVLIWINNSGFNSGDLETSIGEASPFHAVLEKGIAVVTATTVQCQNEGSGGPVGAGTFRPPAFAGAGNDYDRWDDITFPNHWKSTIHLVQWARENAATYGFDPDRVALGGRSGGSHGPIFCGHGLEWSTYTGATGQFRDGISSRPNAVYVFQHQTYWGAFPTSTYVAALPDSTAPLTTIAASIADSVLALRREASSIWYCFDESTYPGVQDFAAATPIYMFATDDIGSADFTLDGFGLPNENGTLSALHDGWHTGMFWTRLLEVGESFHQARSRVTWLNSKAPTTSEVPYRQKFETTAEVYEDAAAWLLGALDLSPTAEPVTERILANIDSTLSAVEASGTYWHTIREVEVVDGAFVYGHQTPAAYIRPLRDDMDGVGQTLTSSVRHDFLVQVSLVIGTGSKPSRALQRLVTDATAALYADRTRGGNAVTTIIESVDYSYPATEQGVNYVATLTLRTPFRTSPTDLSVSF